MESKVSETKESAAFTEEELDTAFKVILRIANADYDSEYNREEVRALYSKYGKSLPINRKKYWSGNGTVLHDAAREYNVRTQEVLIQCGGDVNSCNDRGETPLHAAVNSCHGPGAMKAVVAAPGVNLNVVSSDYKMTPLMMAADTGSESCAEVLIAAGAHLDIVTDTGYYGIASALTQAIYRSEVSIARKLIKAGCDVNSFVGDRTPLMRACENASCCDLIAPLVLAGADTTAVNPKGLSSRAFAAKWGSHKNILPTLLDCEQCVKVPVVVAALLCTNEVRGRRSEQYL